jgi:hypothetical protein
MPLPSCLSPSVVAHLGSELSGAWGRSFGVYVLLGLLVLEPLQVAVTTVLMPRIAFTRAQTALEKWIEKLRDDHDAHTSDSDEDEDEDDENEGSGTKMRAPPPITPGEKRYYELLTMALLDGVIDKSEAKVL